jgi:polyphosphate kinase 2 (PPK2 family)
VPIFKARPHWLLVPFDGSFDVGAAATAPDKGAHKDDRWKERLEAVLLIFQALDAAGQDSTIRHVFSGINPCGLHITSFQRMRSKPK